MIICANCDTENRATAKFCDHCGARLEVRCPDCGTINRPEAKFCDNCGQRLGDQGTSSNTEAPPTDLHPASALNSLIPQEYALKLEAARAAGSMVGERRIVTILFCDIKGSTAAAGQLDPEEWAEVINGAFERMIYPVYKYEGTVARLMGDAILAFFGAPIAHEDDPQRAVLAGLEILQDIEPYREQMRQRWKLDFDVRVGINTGLVMAGQVGSDLQMEYTAMGDAINLAARMEQTAQAGMIQVAEATYKLVAPLFEWQDLGEITVKGKDVPVHTYRPLRPKEQPGRLRGLESHGLSSQLVGREAELGYLRQRLESLSSRQGSFVLVMGEAGIGKSRLISELAFQAGSFHEDILWLEGHTLSYRQSSSYYPWREVLRQSIGVAKSDPPAAVRQKLRETGEQFHLPSEDIPFLEVLLAVAGEDTQESIRGYEGEALVQCMTAAARGLICGLAGASPSVLVFDDLHWADPASLDLILNLADVTRLYPLLLIGMLRPDKDAPSWAFRQRVQDRLGSGYAELALTPLPENISRTLLANLLAFDELPENLRALIVRQTDGNPFFVEEVVRDLIQRGLVVKQTDARTGSVTWRASAQMEDFEMPENLLTLLTARIDRLEEEARRTLQLASVIGRSFYYRILDAINNAVHVVRSELSEQLLSLQSAEMILEAARLPEPEYIFRHSLTQQAAYNTILLKQRREFHHRVGEAIEALYAGRLEEFYPVLAYHFGEAGDSRAFDYETLAGDAAFRLYAIAEAMDHYAKAIEIGKGGPEPRTLALLETEKPAEEAANPLTHIYLRLGRCYELQSDYTTALQIYAEMEAIASQTGDRRMALSALMAQATVYAIPTPVQEVEKARSFAESALVLSRKLEDQQAEAKVLWIHLLTYMYSGYMDAGIPYGEQSADLARKTGMAEQLAHALQDLSLTYMAVGDLQKARQALQEASSIWEQLGNLPMLAETRANGAFERVMAGDFEASIALADESWRISREIKNEWGQVNSRMFVTKAYWARGEIDRALENLKTVLPLAKKVGHPGAALTLVQSAIMYESMGAVEKALQAAEEALEAGKAFPPFYAYALAVLARFRLRAGDLDKAADLLQRSADIGHNKTLLEINIFTALVNIELALACGELEQATSVIEPLLALLNDAGARSFLPESLALKARLLEAQNRPKEARASLQAALSVAKETGSRMAIWRILGELAELEDRLGSPEQARALRDQSRRAFEEIAAKIDDPELSAAFQNLMSRYELGTLP